MTIKKLISISVILFGMINHFMQAEEDIAFILFRLVSGEIKIEKYNSQDIIDKGITHIDKEESLEHMVMSINLKEKGAMPRSIGWDNQDSGKINIAIGKGNKAQLYSMLLTSFFKETIDEDEVIAICFDCMVNHEKNKETNEYRSYLNVLFPLKLENTKMEFLFEEKIKSACGFFMTNKDFEKLLKKSGKISKKEAIESGIIFPYDIKPEEIKKN